MQFRTAPHLLLMIALTGCGQGAATTSPEGAETPAAETAALGAPAPAADEAMTAAADGTVVTLTPENTQIQFVGVHTDPQKPDPRTGHFTAFSGSVVTAESMVESISVEIETASLTTEIEKLTNHLKSPDFFNVNEYPKATFVSTAIKPADDGQVQVTGDLTLLGKTQSITFPATVNTENGLSLTADFNLDRTLFGMDFGTDNVAKEVAMTITVNG